MEYIGKPLTEVTKLLKANGITDISVTENFTKPMPNSTLLVTSCKIENNTANITVGSFKLNI